MLTLDSYDNDFLFINDDLFLLLVPIENLPTIQNDPSFSMIFCEETTDGVDRV